MSRRHTIYMVEDLVLVCELPVIAEVGHRVRMPHRVTSFVTLEESEALGGLRWEILLDLECIIDVDVPILLFNVADELIKGLNLFQICHRAYKDELFLSVGESRV